MPTFLSNNRAKPILDNYELRNNVGSMKPDRLFRNCGKPSINRNYSTRMCKAHSNYRDEQFWFTAAVVGCNGIPRQDVWFFFGLCAWTCFELFGIYILTIG